MPAGAATSRFDPRPTGLRPRRQQADLLNRPCAAFIRRPIESGSMVALSAQPILALRSLAFNVFFYGWTTVYCLGVLPAYPLLSAAAMRVVARAWQRVILAGLRVTVGLSHEVRGWERLPAGPVLLACKHQSAWETLAFHALVPDIAIGLKD